MIQTLFTLLIFLAIAPAQANSAPHSTATGHHQTLAELHNLAAAGDANAQLNMGGVFFEGQGVEQNYAEGAKWFRLAAAQGLAQAQFNLGMMYATGMGVTKNSSEAVQWYRLAANQGLAIAQLNLGVAYDYGEGVTKDEREAIKWLRLAANQGEAQAQFNLGVLYAKGQGVEQDLTEAYRYARLAAQQGHATAREMMRDLLGRMTPEQKTSAENLAKNDKKPADKDAAGYDDIYVQLDTRKPSVGSAGKPLTRASSDDLKQARALAESESSASYHPAELAGKPVDTPITLIERFINDWARAWSGKDVDGYLAAYTSDFRQEGLNHDAWKAQRIARITQPATIELKLTEIKITVQDERHATVSFTQTYRANTYHDQEKKILLLIKPLDRWLIATEHIVTTAVKNRPETAKILP